MLQRNFILLTMNYWSLTYMLSNFKGRLYNLYSFLSNRGQKTKVHIIFSKWIDLVRDFLKTLSLMVFFKYFLTTNCIVLSNSLKLITLLMKKRFKTCRISLVKRPPSIKSMPFNTEYSPQLNGLYLKHIPLFSADI